VDVLFLCPFLGVFCIILSAAKKQNKMWAWQVQMLSDDGSIISQVGLNTKTNPNGTCVLPPACHVKYCNRRVGLVWGLCRFHLRKLFHMDVRKSVHLSSLGLQGMGLYAYCPSAAGAVFKEGYPLPFHYGPMITDSYIDNLCLTEHSAARFSTFPYVFDVGSGLDATAIRTPIAWMNDARPSAIPNVEMFAVKGSRVQSIVTRNIYHGNEMLTDYGNSYFSFPSASSRLVRVQPAKESAYARYGLVFRIKPAVCLLMEHEDVPQWPKVFSAGRYTKRRAPLVKRRRTCQSTTFAAASPDRFHFQRHDPHCTCHLAKCPIDGASGPSAPGSAEVAQLVPVPRFAHKPRH
jgi:hypothetical protein